MKRPGFYLSLLATQPAQVDHTPSTVSLVAVIGEAVPPRAVVTRAVAVHGHGARRVDAALGAQDLLAQVALIGQRPQRVEVVAAQSALVRGARVRLRYVALHVLQPVHELHHALLLLLLEHLAPLDHFLYLDQLIFRELRVLFDRFLPCVTRPTSV
jgi:hypothetical protein